MAAVVLLGVRLGLRGAAAAPAFVATVALLALLAAGSFLYVVSGPRTPDPVDAAVGRIAATQTVINQTERLLSALQEAEMAQRNFLITDDAQFLDDWEKARTDVDDRFAALHELITDADQHQRLAGLAAMVWGRLTSLEAVLKQAQTGADERVRIMVRDGHGSQIMRSVRDGLRLLALEEQRLLAEHEAAATRARRQQQDRMQQVSGAATLLLLLLCLVLAFTLALRSAANRRLADAAERLNREIALRQVRSRLLALTEALPQLIWTGSRDGSATFLSPHWQSYTGQDSAAGPGHAWLESIHPEDRDRLLPMLADTPPDQAVEGVARQP